LTVERLFLRVQPYIPAAIADNVSLIDNKTYRPLAGLPKEYLK